MADGDQQEERREEPTEKQRRKFRDEGKVAKSQEVNTAFLFSGLLLVWFFYLPGFWQEIQMLLTYFWKAAGTFELTAESSGALLNLSIIRLSGIMWPLMLASVIMGIGANLLQIGFLFTTKPMQPKFSKLNPIKGIKRLLSKRSLIELLKSLMKLAVVVMIIYSTLAGSVEDILILSQVHLEKSLHYYAEMCGKIMFKCCIALLLIAVLDYLYQRWDMKEQMKMTNKEVRDEHKDTDGDPQLKRKIKTIQREMANKRMMAQVPDSDVVITNPEHIAVALVYHREKMEAPQVVAKGTDFLAWRIRTLARENKVPVVRNPPLARTLNEVEVGQRIPEDMFKAVAEILAYVYSLKGRNV